jgi:prolyl 4-hydroxylase
MQEPPKKAVALLPKDWLSWIEENFVRGCDPVGMVEILLQNGFTLEMIRATLGDRCPAKYATTAEVSEDVAIDYAALANIPASLMEWVPGFSRIETPQLQLFVLEHFLTDEECDKLLSIINSTELKPSTTTRPVEGYRTSYTNHLGLNNDPFIDVIDKKIASAIGVNASFAEGMQAQKYDVGQEFKSQTDYFEPGTEEYRHFAGHRGNRTWTFMIYLNDTAKGGGTRFVNLDKTIYPKKGRAVVWNNRYPDGKPNKDSLHWGMPVEEGQKIIITKWFREKGIGPMFINNAS